MLEEFNCFKPLYSGLLRKGPGDAAGLAPALQDLPDQLSNLIWI